MTRPDRQERSGTAHQNLGVIRSDSASGALVSCCGFEGVDFRTSEDRARVKFLVPEVKVEVESGGWGYS